MAAVAAIMDKMDRNKMVLAILNLHVAPVLHNRFGSIRLNIQELMRFEDFQDGHLGGHLRYRNRTILAFLNPYVPRMPSINLGLNLHFDLGRDVV